VGEEEPAYRGTVFCPGQKLCGNKNGIVQPAIDVKNIADGAIVDFIFSGNKRQMHRRVQLPKSLKIFLFSLFRY
jgi:hypothetical protein